MLTTKQPRRGFIDGGLARRHTHEELRVSDLDLTLMDRGELDRITRFTPDPRENANVRILVESPTHEYIVEITATAPVITTLPTLLVRPEWVDPEPQAYRASSPGFTGRMRFPRSNGYLFADPVRLPPDYFISPPASGSSFIAWIEGS